MRPNVQHLCELVWVDLYYRMSSKLWIWIERGRASVISRVFLFSNVFLMCLYMHTQRWQSLTLTYAEILVQKKQDVKISRDASYVLCEYHIWINLICTSIIVHFLVLNVKCLIVIELIHVFPFSPEKWNDILLCSPVLRSCQGGKEVDLSSCSHKIHLNQTQKDVQEAAKLLPFCSECSVRTASLTS